MAIHDFQILGISHVELRPIIHSGGDSTPVFMHEADYYDISWAAEGLRMYHRTFEQLDEAVDYLLTDPKFAGVPRWYEGAEIVQEFASKEDLLFVLCGSECYPDDELIEFAQRLGFSPKESNALIACYRARS